MKLAICVFLALGSACYAFLAGTCNMGPSDPFIQTAEVIRIMNFLSTQTLKVWANTAAHGLTCVDAQINFTNKTYKVYSTKSDGTQQSTSGTVVVKRDRDWSTITFTQTTKNINTGLFGVDAGGSKTWQLSYINPTDMVLSACEDSLFTLNYDNMFLSSADMDKVSATCFKTVMASELEIQNQVKLNRTLCKGYTTSL